MLFDSGLYFASGKADWTFNNKKQVLFFFLKNETKVKKQQGEQRHGGTGLGAHE